MIPNTHTLAIAAFLFLVLLAGIFFSQEPIFHEGTSFIPQSNIDEVTPYREEPAVSSFPLATSSAEKPALAISNEQKKPIAPPPPIVFIYPPVPQASTTIGEKKSEALPIVEKKPKIGAFDENLIFRAVVKIQCPASDGVGKSIGSGFVLGSGLVVTVAHLLMDSASDTCDVIFPNNRFPIHYLKAKITEDTARIRERLEKDGIDIAFLKMPPMAEYSDARSIFGSAYPSLPYPLCSNPAIIGNVVYHYGYPSSFKDLNYLSRMEGTIVSYADVSSVSPKISEDYSTYLAPDFYFTISESQFHPYAVSKVGIYYGDSGGLVFDATNACVLGVNHGFGMNGSTAFSIYTILSYGIANTLFTSYGIK